MPFSISCGLSFMTVLLFFPAQGKLQCATPAPPIRPTKLYGEGIHFTCCLNVSTAPVRETVNACYEQKEDTFADCKIHSYIFVSESKRCYCVDPNASWLPNRLKKLEERGIICQPLPPNLDC
ncbi:hypothetical protein ABVT39_001984 [Epinephelus coioides]